MIRASDLRERLAFQENTTTPDALGGESSAFATIQTISGMVLAVSGREIAQGGGVSSLVSYRVTVRHGQLEAAKVSVSSITETGGTATVTTAAAHGLATDEYVRIGGATPTDYNARWKVTVTNSTIYTFSITGGPDDATGTVTSSRLKPISAAMQIVWTPSWDGAQVAKTLEILTMRPFAKDPRRWMELDCGEVN